MRLRRCLYVKIKGDNIRVLGDPTKAPMYRYMHQLLALLSLAAVSELSGHVTPSILHWGPVALVPCTCAMQASAQRT